MKDKTSMPRRNELEHKALHVIANNGNDGVLQSELWRKMDATSREGSRIALKLETKGLIRREKELFEGRWTYRLFPKRKPASLNSIINSPCLMCPNDSKCGPWSQITPNECPRLTAWILGIEEPEVELSGED
ncbi:MAG: transcriptional regulator [Candidatus Bathyarchaeota archaeon]|nr:transcriptional regulator [Candidatus Bathyarchaeota archaeon]